MSIFFSDILIRLLLVCIENNFVAIDHVFESLSKYAFDDRGFSKKVSGSMELLSKDKIVIQHIISIKETVVLLNRIPKNWKFLTLRKKTLTSTRNNHLKVRAQQPAVIDSVPNTDNPIDSDMKNKIDLIVKNINVLKRRISDINELIIWLFTTMQNYLETLLELYAIVETLNVDHNVKANIQRTIEQAFQIEQQIHFENSPNSYVFTGNGKQFYLALVNTSTNSNTSNELESHN